MKSSKLLYSMTGAVAAVILLACGSSDPSSSPADGTTPDTNKVQGDTPQKVATVEAGKAVDITTGSGDKLTVTVSDPKAAVASGNEFITPEKGQFFTVVVTVEFKSGEATYFASPDDLKLIASDGTVFQAEFISTITPEFPTVQLNAGQKASGRVVFDVPKTVQPGAGAKIQFTGSWDGKAAAFWTI